MEDFRSLFNCIKLMLAIKFIVIYLVYYWIIWIYYEKIVYFLLFQSLEIVSHAFVVFCEVANKVLD